MRHGAPLAALLALLALAGLGLGLGLGGCGDGGEDTESDTAAAELEADVETLNTILSRQLAVVDAYGRSLPSLRGGALTLATQFRRQEQEHVDALLKELRDLGGEEEAEEEEIESGPLKSEAQHLRFLYEVESETIEDELGAVGRLSSAGARTVLASMVANQAQHLVLLRRALGAVPLEWVPEPFETGAAPAP